MFNYRVGVKIGDIPAQQTAFVRMNAIYYPFIEFTKSPLLGIGFSGYNRIGERLGYHMFTFTPVNYFAYFGLTYGVICVNGFAQILKKMNLKGISRLILILLAILAVSSEDFCGGTACITVFILYGYKRSCTDNREKAYENSLYQ